MDKKQNLWISISLAGKTRVRKKPVIYIPETGFSITKSIREKRKTKTRKKTLSDFVSLQFNYYQNMITQADSLTHGQVVLSNHIN